ncbi:MAG TPA: EAL domain-containing protein, partial [Burkholderiaceae bacterium]
MPEPVTPRHDLLALQLSALISQHNVEIHFQPLVDVNRGSILGYEALTRGPADSPLHSPLVLFDLAARLGRLVDLERVVARKALTRFRELALPGQLFLNLTV